MKRLDIMTTQDRLNELREIATHRGMQRENTDETKLRRDQLIRELHAEDETIKTLCRASGLTRSTIYRIIDKPLSRWDTE